MSRPSDRLHRAAARLIVATLALCLAGCGPVPPVRLDPSRNRLPLDAWVSVLDETPAGARPCVRVSAPHRSLVFRQGDDERFHSGLEVRVVAWRDGVRVGGGVQTVRVAVPDIEATRTETAVEVTVPLVIRGGEPVTLDVAVRVVETSRAWSRELSFSPQALDTLPLWIESATALPAASPGGDHLVDSSVDTLRVRATLHRRAGAPAWPAGDLSLVNEATGAALGEVLLRRRPIPSDLAPGEARQLEVAWAADELPFGRCRVQALVELVRDTAWFRLPHDPPLNVVNLRVNLSGEAEWRRQVDWLDGVVAASRRDSLRELDAPERPAAWATIWREAGFAAGVDPEAAERQHLLRIVTADDRFGAYGRGARSDRGRTLIRWGEPARIESYADTRAAGAMWEVWDYPERDRRLFFFDAHGSGDFRLRRDEPVAP